MTPHPSSIAPGTSQERYKCDVATSKDKRDVAAKSPYAQQVEKSLDVSQYIKQLERLLSKPIKIPGTTLLPYHGGLPRPRQSIFSVRGIWPYADQRKEKISKLFNFSNSKGREWVKELLLEESESDDDEAMYSQRDLRIMMKMHKSRRRLQKKYHSNKVAGQFSNYSAGFLSVQDTVNDSSGRVRPLVPTKANDQPLSVHSTSILPPLPDDISEHLSVDPNVANSTVIPLPPLSH